MGLSEDLERAAQRLGKVKTSFAISRNDFVERIYDVLTGALGEQYKAVVGDLIGELRYVSHWRDEVEDHLYVLERILLKETKGNFSKRKALEAALVNIQRSEMSQRKWAISHLRGERYQYSVPKSVVPTLPAFDQAWEQFLQGVYQVAREVLV